MTSSWQAWRHPGTVSYGVMAAAAQPHNPATAGRKPLFRARTIRPPKRSCQRQNHFQARFRNLAFLTDVAGKVIGECIAAIVRNRAIDMVAESPLASGAGRRTLEQAIVDTVRQPLLVLDEELRVVTASRSFYAAFKVNRQETEGRLLFELGNCQWDIPDLRKLLEDVIPQHTTIEKYEVEGEFPAIGQRTMLLNARKIFYEETVLPVCCWPSKMIRSAARLSGKRMSSSTKRTFCSGR